MGKQGRPLRTTRQVTNLAGRPGWYTISNQAAQGPVQVSIYDEIGMLGVSANDLLRDLAGVEGDIELHLNSPGGDVFDGIAIFNQLKQRKGTVAVVVDGLAASAASFIAQAASPGKLGMAPHSQMMIHDGFGMAIGNAADMRQMADLLDKASDNIARIYADRSGKPAAQWREQMRDETWLDDHEAVAAGLADYVVGSEAVHNKWDLSVYLKAPGYDPDGDGDDDSTPEGDTDDDRLKISNAEKYSAEDRKAMASKGHAMPDGSYPIADEQDLDNAIHAVGRGGSDHDAIRRHIIKRAEALGQSSKIPENWNADGSMKDLAVDRLWAAVATALEGADL